MKFASYRHDTSVPFAGARTEPVSGDYEESVIGAGSPDSMRRANSLEQVQSEMPIWTFLSEVPAARGLILDESAETEQSDWLKERSNPS